MPDHTFSPKRKALAIFSAACLASTALLALEAPATAEGEAESETITDQSAREIFGVSDDNGTDTIDAYRIQQDPETNEMFVPVFQDEQTKHSSIDQAITADAQQRGTEDTVEVVESAYTEEQIEGALEELTSLAIEYSLKIFFNYNVQIDAIQAEVTVDSADAIGTEIGGVEIANNIQEPENLDRFDNDWYGSPHYGGMYAWGGALNGGGNENANCTLGIPATNASGTPGIFTAGHCFELGASVYTADTTSSEYSVGHVSHSFTHGGANPGIDSAFVSGGDEYRGFVMTGGGRDTAKRITGEYFPTRGDRVCYNGAETGRGCNGAVQSYGNTFCAADGCTRDLIQVSGDKANFPWFGDSGAPTYVNFGDTVKVAGTLVGSAGIEGDVWSFSVQDWRATKSAYGATLMTG